MVKALIVKFSDPILAQRLMSLSDDDVLVEHTTRDKFWGDGGDGGKGIKGENYLGKILTALRWVLKYGNCDSRYVPKPILEIVYPTYRKDAPLPPDIMNLSMDYLTEVKREVKDGETVETPYVGGKIHGIQRTRNNKGDIVREIPYVNNKKHVTIRWVL